MSPVCRSVYYSDREQSDPDRTYDLIIRDTEPYNTFTESNNVINNVSNNVIAASNENNLLNNVVLNLESQRFPNHAESNFMKKVNNVSKENTEQEHQCVLKYEKWREWGAARVPNNDCVIRTQKHIS